MPHHTDPPGPRGEHPRGEHPRDDRRRETGVPSAPFDLPVLAEVPELASLLADLRQVDLLIARAIDTLITLQDAQLAEAATGVALGQWLATIGRRTGADRRMLTTAATTCRRLPVLREAFRAGRVSWCQVRAVACKLQRVPHRHDARIETELTTFLEELTEDADPATLPRMLDWLLRDLDDDPVPEPSGAPRNDFLALSPRADGSGGTVFGDFGPEGFAALDAHLRPSPGGRTKSGLGADRDPDRAADTAATLARGRAEALLDLLCAHRDDAGDHRTGDATAGRSRSGDAQATRTRVLARVELSTLLGGHLPGQLLTHLTGGTLRVDAATSRRLADHADQLRLVVVDQGRVVGVGRRRRTAPGWLTDALLALHDTCSGPGCEVAARLCDTDHARPWEAGGATDLDNLAPLCATDNHAKEREGWRCAQAPDGVRRWHHQRSGLTSTTHPGTWTGASAAGGRRAPPA